MGEKLHDWNPAEYLETPEEIEAFLEEAFETGDVSYICKALGIVAQAKGMSQIAKETGLNRTQLYRSFSPSGNPTLETTIKVLHSMGVTLKAVPEQHQPPTDHH